METFPSVGELVRPEDLVGREPIIQTLCGRIENRERFYIAAPRWTGKTSVIREVLRRMRERGWMTAYVDIFRAVSLEDFGEKMADAVLENETGIPRTLRHVQSVMESALARVGLSFKTDEAGEFAVRYARRPVPWEEAIDLAERLAARQARPMVAVLDECQDGRKLHQRFFHVLRSHIQEHHRVVWVFLGSLTTLVKALFTRESEPLYARAQHQPLPEVPAEEWAAYVLRKLRAAGVPADEAIARQLVDEAGAHPGTTMAVAAAYLRLARENPDEPAHRLARRAAEAALIGLEPMYGEVWRHMESIRYAQLIAKRIAEGCSPWKGVPRLYAAQVQRALSFLIDSGVVADKGGPGTPYRFTQPMFAEYIRRLTG